MIVDIDTLLGSHPTQEHDASLPTLLRVLEANDIGRALVYSRTALLFDSEVGNAETLAVCRAHPSLAPVAVVDPRNWGAWDQVARWAEAGCVAFRFFPQEQGWSLESASFRRTLAAVAGTGRPALVEVGVSGMTAQAARAAQGLALPLVLTNVSYWVLAEVLAEVAINPNLYLEAHRVCLPGQAEVMAEAVGAERLLFGSC
ncbi:MAG: hypothetical protein IT330_14870, partial [Anaerolineae bacterium]|nr:hypothetical protein [Anaerolineae bacterium]